MNSKTTSHVFCAADKVSKKRFAHLLTFAEKNQQQHLQSFFAMTSTKHFSAVYKIVPNKILTLGIFHVLLGAE